MKAIILLLVALSFCQYKEDPLKIVFYTFDAIDGFATALFDEAGAEKATDCLEDVKEIELIVDEVKQLITNFNTTALIMEVVKVISEISEIFDDCFAMPAQFKILTDAFGRMIYAFQHNMKVAMMKLVLSIIGEGTNLEAQIKSIISNIQKQNYFIVGNQIGRIVAMLTIKLY